MEEKQKKIQDRLQYIGLIGPLILLLTLFCTLIKGSPKSGYLFLATLVALPLSWKWRLKGFVGSMGFLASSFLIFYTFFSAADRFWQFGATLSLALGLFITFMGFEEIKNALEKINLESQSRLDNLIDLDEKFNKAQEAWRYEEAELKDELEKKASLLKREQEELLSLEKMSATLRSELEVIQSSNTDFLEEIEIKARAISSLEQQVLQSKERVREVELKLAQNTSDREEKTLEELDLLKGELSMKEEELLSLTERLQGRLELEVDLEEQVQKKEDAFKNIQEALRQKVAAIHEFEEKILLRDRTINQQKDEINDLLKAINQKEHELLTVKSGLGERDCQIQKLNQKLRDLNQDLGLSKSKLEEKRLELKNVEIKNQQEVSRWENACKTNEVQLKHHAAELLTLRQNLEKSEVQLSSLHQDKELLKKELLAQEEGFRKTQEKEELLREKQFAELRKLNDARFALFQASLDKERLKAKEPSTEPKPAKHWLVQVDQLLKGENHKKVDFSLLPRDLSKELLGMNQAKALYKQLRSQFDEKNEILEEARAQLYQAETKIEEMSKHKEEQALKGSIPEQALENQLAEKAEEISFMEKEVETLNTWIGDLLNKMDESRAAQTK